MHVTVEVAGCDQVGKCGHRERAIGHVGARVHERKELLLIGFLRCGN
eukprot:COSAG01_NODE_42475_length_439_cov_6.367647_2_plen_46_part_01